MTQEEEYSYLDKVLAGDARAYAYLINQHKGFVFSLCLKIVKNREDAEELAQDVFLKAFQSLGSFRRNARFSTWLYRIAYHSALNKLKKKKLVQESLDSEGYNAAQYLPDTTFESQFDVLQKEQQQQYIRLALQRLPEEDHILLSLFYLSEHSIEEISEITDISNNNIKVKLHRARKKLYGVLANLLQHEIHHLL